LKPLFRPSDNIASAVGESVGSSLVAKLPERNRRSLAQHFLIARALIRITG
jgi:hypothetical protein